MDPTVIHFEITAENLEKLKAFYEKIFGWNIVKHIPVPVVDMEYWSI